jgi:hypothetical protein
MCDPNCGVRGGAPEVNFALENGLGGTGVLPSETPKAFA